MDIAHLKTELINLFISDGLSKEDSLKLVEQIFIAVGIKYYEVAMNKMNPKEKRALIDKLVFTDISGSDNKINLIREIVGEKTNQQFVREAVMELTKEIRLQKRSLVS